MRENKVMRYMVFLALITAIGLAGQDKKPACNAGNQGRFWPLEANSSQHAARELYQSGTLEVCSQVVWKYKWERMSVNVRDLTKERHSSTSAPRRAVTQESK